MQKGIGHTDAFPGMFGGGGARYVDVLKFIREYCIWILSQKAKYNGLRDDFESMFAIANQDTIIRLAGAKMMGKWRQTMGNYRWYTMGTTQTITDAVCFPDRRCMAIGLFGV